MRTTSTHAALPQIKPAQLHKFHVALQQWYERHGRHDLPWRHTDDSYRIWLSEVMLQQTQVATVLSRFYHPFLERFPTVNALAAAPQEAVLKAWEGLGYYSRARNLHAAAKRIVLEGGFPPLTRKLALSASLQDASLTLPLRRNVYVSPASPTQLLFERLLNLPGIGRNTATAILAFAYHQPVAILEANVKRIVARIFALETPSDVELWAGAETLLNHAKPFDYNQAMMDLGSLICLPKYPKCNECPANNICKGKANPTAYPAPKVKKQTPVREVTIEVREDAQGRIYLEPRAEKLLGGLYGFPQVPLQSSNSRPEGEAKARSGRVSEAKVGKPPSINILGTVTHTYSHFKLIGHVVGVKVNATANSPYWHSLAEISDLPLSTVDHKVLALVEKRHSAQKKTPKDNLT